jgi:cell division protein FtsW (lipid II flippase)
MRLLEQQSIRSLNKIILISIGVLCFFSLIMIYSATSTRETTIFRYNFFLKQLVWVCVSFILMLYVSRINYEFWIGHAPWLYYITITLINTSSNWQKCLRKCKMVPFWSDSFSAFGVRKSRTGFNADKIYCGQQR